LEMLDAIEYRVDTGRFMHGVLHRPTRIQFNQRRGGGRKRIRTKNQKFAKICEIFARIFARN